MSPIDSRNHGIFDDRRELLSSGRKAILIKKKKTQIIINSSIRLTQRVSKDNVENKGNPDRETIGILRLEKSSNI